MNTFANHVVIVGGPEATDELLAMVLDDGEAIPLFESVRRRRRSWPLPGTSARIGGHGRLRRENWSSFSSTRATRSSTWR
jgi:hypothetical protein